MCAIKRWHKQSAMKFLEIRGVTTEVAFDMNLKNPIDFNWERGVTELTKWDN